MSALGIAKFWKPSLQAAHATPLRCVARFAFRYGFQNPDPSNPKPRNP